jgi:hypothetical protein
MGRKLLFALSLLLLDAAARIRVKVEPQSYTADYKAKGASPKFVDEVDYHRHRFEK